MQISPAIFNARSTISRAWDAIFPARVGRCWCPSSLPNSRSRSTGRNGCASGTSLYFEQGDGRCEAYSGCAGAAVALCTIDGGGHSWPGGAPPAEVVPCPANGPQSTTFIASEVIARFFAEHPR